MPIRIKTDLEWGDVFYMKADPDQSECHLVEVIATPGNILKFRLSCMGDIYEVYDFEVSTDPDQIKKLNNQKGEE